MTRKKKKEVPPEVELKMETIKVANQILQETGNDPKVPVALLAIATLEVHRYMALVLRPICPNAFGAHVKALRKTLDKVLKYLNDSTLGQDAKPYFANLVLTRLNHFIEFLAYCYGNDIKLVPVKGSEGEILEGLHIVIEEEPEPELNFEDLRPTKDVSIYGSYKKFMGDLGVTFKNYYNRLFGYINQKANGSTNLPVEVAAYSFAHLYDAVNIVLPKTCKGVAPDGYVYNTPPVGDAALPSDAFAIEGTIWFDGFLIHTAWCYGVDLNVRAEIKQDGVEIAHVYYTISGV